MRRELNHANPSDSEDLQSGSILLTYTFYSPSIFHIGFVEICYVMTLEIFATLQAQQIFFCLIRVLGDLLSNMVKIIHEMVCISYSPIKRCINLPIHIEVL